MVSEHFLGQKWRILFLLLLFAGFRGRRVCRSDLYVLVKDLQNLIANLDSMWKNSDFKKNRSNWSPDEGDIANLKISGVADNFSGQRICGTDLDILVQDMQNLITYLDSLWKNTQFQKKISEIGVRMREISLV